MSRQTKFTMHKVCVQWKSCFYSYRGTTSRSARSPGPSEQAALSPALAGQTWHSGGQSPECTGAGRGHRRRRLPCPSARRQPPTGPWGRPLAPSAAAAHFHSPQSDGTRGEETIMGNVWNRHKLKGFDLELSLRLNHVIWIDLKCTCPCFTFELEKVGLFWGWQTLTCCPLLLVISMCIMCFRLKKISLKIKEKFKVALLCICKRGGCFLSTSNPHWWSCCCATPNNN